jgi:hypothetical protein
MAVGVLFLQANDVGVLLLQAIYDGGGCPTPTDCRGATCAAMTEKREGEMKCNM